MNKSHSLKESKIGNTVCMYTLLLCVAECSCIALPFEHVVGILLQDTDISASVFQLLEKTVVFFSTGAKDSVPGSQL